MQISNNTGTLQVDYQNTIATVTFGHPAGNSFTGDLLQKISALIHEISLNKAIKIIVLQSQGDSPFCGGASFDELLTVSTFEEGKQFFSGFAHLILALKNAPQITIARVQGKAVGGGVGIIAACDYAIATAKSNVKLSELSIGIGPFVIEPVVSHKIGKTAMSKMTFEAHLWQTPEWALQNGLFAHLVNENELDITIQNFSKKLASYNPEALFNFKKIIWEGTENWNKLLFERAEISGKLTLSEFTKETLKSLKSKS